MLNRIKLVAAVRRRWLEVPPEWLFVQSFAILVAIGTAGLLWLPGLYSGPALGFIDALFTATSAVCVTGLAVVDTATYFSVWGQAWILLLIQLGGLGLIGITSALIAAMGSRLSLRTEMLAVPAFERLRGQKVTSLTAKTVKFTLATEAVVALLLWLLWLPDFPAATAAWHALFHAVSAFCNAGFSTFSDSLVSQASHPAVLTLLSFAVVLGGFGYLSAMELAAWFRGRSKALTRRRLSVHTFAAATCSAGLLGVGALLYAFLEWNGVLDGMGTLDALSNAWFMSVTARTAGFNSVGYDQLTNGSVLVTLALMIIGGSPGSTAGGVKTTALVILLALAVARIRGRRFVEIHHRSVPDGTVQRTISLLVLFFLVMVTANALLAFTEAPDEIAAARASFLPVLFEAVSALGTVGLSMGVTADLSEPGRAVVIATMFVGRVGPLAFFALISFRSAARTAIVRAAAEDVIVG